MKLALLQERFWRLITAPERVAVALPELVERDPDLVPLRRWIAADSEAAALERLDVYANMYFFRLLDLLRQDYPNLAKLVGDDAFHNLVTGYLLAYPSDRPSLRWVGRHLPEYLEAHELGRHVPAAASLARLEWVRGEVFDLEDTPIATMADLAGATAETWSAMRLELVPALRLIDLDVRVLPLWLALERGDAERPDAPAESIAVLIWRRGFRVYHRVVDPAERALLRAASARASFAALCEVLWPFAGDDTPRHALTCLRTWLEHEMVASVTFPP